MLSFLLDHLWQSTLLALAIGLLVLALRKAPAAVRHGLWFAASIKFLIPFAALAALGRVLGPRLLPATLPAPLAASSVHAAPAAALIAKAAEPLAKFPLGPSSSLLQAPLPPAGPGPAAQVAHHAAIHLDPGPILLAVWAAGFAFVSVRWMVRWARVRRALRSARPLDWAAPMPVLASPTLLEPGLIGFLRPVLVVPQSLPMHLTRSQIDAILAHEICHLRRRDNLTAAVHTLAEAVFWFHPLLWWIGARLIAERESACDETVVRAGHDRTAYARSLVESARLYVQSPLSCVAGASGSDLKTRVEAIMTAPLSSPLSRSKKALLLAAASFAVATPVAAGLLTPQARQAAAPLARAMAALSAPARALGVDSAALAPDQAVTDKPVVLASNAAILAPGAVVTATDARPLALARTIVPPQVDPTPSPADRPTELAVATPPAPAAHAGEAANTVERATSFVQSYAAATGQRQAIARWAHAICVRVVGLADRAADPQGAAVRARIEEVAEAVGLQVQSGNCIRSDIEVGFTSDPQAMLDGVIKTRRRLVGDKTSGTQSATTVTLPIQAWYETNGKYVASNDAGGLKALADYRANGSPGLKIPVLYQYAAPGAGQPTASSNIGVGEYGGGGGAYQGYFGGPGVGLGPPSYWNSTRQFLNAFVIVDVKRTGSANLRLLSDYVAMLALSQPKALGSCQALPSIVDLFANCAGRPAPDGLTVADMAYLHALYDGDDKTRGEHPAVVADVVDAMAPLLANPKVASR